MNDTTSLVGKILDETAKRDAVHFAVAPVVADRDIEPGDHLAFAEEGNSDLVTLVAQGHRLAIGIADPFLSDTAKKGQRFFLFLYPQSITSLRHEWTHPAFENAEAVRVMDKVGYGEESRQWLERYASQVYLSVEEVLQAARENIETGEYHCLNFDTPDIVYTKKEEFWRHYEILTGTKVEDKEATFFRCAC